MFGGKFGNIDIISYNWDINQQTQSVCNRLNDQNNEKYNIVDYFPCNIMVWYSTEFDNQRIDAVER